MKSFEDNKMREKWLSDGHIWMTVEGKSEMKSILMAPLIKWHIKLSVEEFSLNPDTWSEADIRPGTVKPVKPSLSYHLSFFFFLSDRFTRVLQ